MALVPYTPFRSLQREINSLFEEAFGDRSPFLSGWHPSVDITENQEEFHLTAELPGVRSEDVKINMTNNVLTIYGEKKQETETKEQNYYRVERNYGTFQRAFTFPSPVQAEKINAKFKDGVLTITLPKAEEAKPKQIPIKIEA